MLPTTRARAGSLSFIALMVTTLLMAASWSAVSAQANDETELTWAPLVTPPPLLEPPIWSPTDEVDGFSMGSPDAPVVVEVWEDFQCPFCQRFTFEIEPSIVDRYVESGEVRLVFRNLAFLGNESHWAAVAGSLAADQNKFWPFHDYLFANLQAKESGGFHIDRLVEMGEAAGLDMDTFKEGLVLENARQRFAEIDAEARRDAGLVGINATPTLTINGVPLQAPDFASIADAIDIELAKASTAESESDEPVSESDEPEEASDTDE